jgi:hypothetical protein
MMPAAQIPHQLFDDGSEVPIDKPKIGHATPTKITNYPQPTVCDYATPEFAVALTPILPPGDGPAGARVHGGTSSTTRL